MFQRSWLRMKIRHLRIRSINWRMWDLLRMLWHFYWCYCKNKLMHVLEWELRKLLNISLDTEDLCQKLTSIKMQLSKVKEWVRGRQSLSRILLRISKHLFYLHFYEKFDLHANSTLLLSLETEESLDILASSQQVLLTIAEQFDLTALQHRVKISTDYCSVNTKYKNIKIDQIFVCMIK